MNHGFPSSIGDIGEKWDMGLLALTNIFLGAKEERGDLCRQSPWFCARLLLTMVYCWDAGMTCAYGFRTLLTHG